jgi:guanylate kinase
MNKEGRIFVMSGPSGAGKGTLIDAMMKNVSHLHFSVSATTRSPRPGETDGLNYYFNGKNEFQSKIDSGEMLEYTMYNGNYYGTPLSSVLEVIKTGEDVFLDIEVVGAANVKRLRPDAITIFLMPPSEKELERRLRGRQTDTEEQILGRLARAKEEMLCAPQYDYIVVNDDLLRAVSEVTGIIGSERKKE